MATFASYATPSQHAFSTPYNHTSLNTPFQSLIATVPQTPLQPEELVSTETQEDVVVEGKSLNSEELGKIFCLYKDCRRLYASRNFVEGLPLNTPKFSLHTVDLSNNSLSTLDGFDVLVNLAFLNVSENNISSTWGLNSNTKLVELHISNNSIRLIEGLERLKRLKVVDFSHNRIKTYSDVRSLSLNSSLASITFRGNVLATYSNFKFKVLHLFPGVTVLGDRERATAHDVHQRHLEMIEDGGRNSAIGKVVANAAEGAEEGGQGGGKRSSPGKSSGYHAMATIAMQNVPDERTRGGLTGSVSQTGGLAMSSLKGSSSNHGLSAAYSQFGHGSGSKVTTLNMTSSARRTAAKQRQQGLSDDKDRFAMKPLPWRQPPAPQPHVTRRVSVVLDDAKEGTSSTNFEDEVWWTPSRYKDSGGPHFQPMPNQPDAVKGGRRGREKRAREWTGSASGAGTAMGAGGRREFSKSSSLNFAGNMSAKKGGRSAMGKSTGKGGHGGKVTSGKSDGGVGMGGSSTPGKARKYKVTLGMSHGHHLIGTPSHQRHGNEKPVIYAKPVSKSLVNMQSTPRGKYKMKGTGEEINMAPDTGGRSLFGKSVYQYAEGVYGRGGGGGIRSPAEKGQKQRETVVSSPPKRQIGEGPSEDWMNDATGSGGTPGFQRLSLFGNPSPAADHIDVVRKEATPGGAAPNGNVNPTVMEVRMKQIGGGGITLDDRLVEVLKVMVKNKKQGIQDIGRGGG